jgi:hypothetical protein
MLSWTPSVGEVIVKGAKQFLSRLAVPAEVSREPRGTTLKRAVLPPPSVCHSLVYAAKSRAPCVAPTSYTTTWGTTCV